MDVVPNGEKLVRRRVARIQGSIDSVLRDLGLLRSDVIVICLLLACASQIRIRIFTIGVKIKVRDMVTEICHVLYAT